MKMRRWKADGDEMESPPLQGGIRPFLWSLHAVMGVTSTGRFFSFPALIFIAVLRMGNHTLSA